MFFANTLDHCKYMIGFFSPHPSRLRLDTFPTSGKACERLLLIRSRPTGEVPPDVDALRSAFNPCDGVDWCR